MPAFTNLLNIKRNTYIYKYVKIKCLFNSLVNLLTGLFTVVSVVVLFNSLYILGFNHLSRGYLRKISFHSVDCIFVLLIVSYAGPPVLNLI